MPLSRDPAIRERQLAALKAGREKQKAQPKKKPLPQGAPEVLSVSSSADDRAQIPQAKPLRAPGQDAASQKQIEEWLAPVLGGVTLLLALWLAGGDENSEVADAVALTNDELDALVPPLARLVTRSPLNKKWGQSLIQSADYVGAAVALASYGMRIWPLVQLKMGGAYGHPATVQGNNATPAGPSAPGANGHGNAAAPGLYSAYQ